MVGLGNPGKKYSRTRHNIGFMVAEEIARRYEIDLKEEEKYRIGRGSIDGEKVLLIEPLLYMNRSGLAVKDIISRFNIPLEKLIVIHDDLDMEVGKLRIRRKGLSGGHKGVESIIQSVSSKEFIRLKIGIGREAGFFAEDYVLTRFRKDEIFLIKKAIEKALDAVTSILLDGLDEAMNRFNRD
ncbi:MAG: aminoacyl-tRNA hydrolase [Thermodesulfovibrionales bacterium]|nr:aminoacyl-tRNA hydrolase [Thermodesulfovibrionales bacterium]